MSEGNGQPAQTAAWSFPKVIVGTRVLAVAGPAWKQSDLGFGFVTQVKNEAVDIMFLKRGGGSSRLHNCWHRTDPRLAAGKTEPFSVDPSRGLFELAPAEKIAEDRATQAEALVAQFDSLAARLSALEQQFEAVTEDAPAQPPARPRGRPPKKDLMNAGFSSASGPVV